MGKIEPPAQLLPSKLLYTVQKNEINIGIQFLIDDILANAITVFLGVLLTFVNR